MQIPKADILDLIKARGNREQIARAEAELPKMVDTDIDHLLLATFAHDPADLDGGNLASKFGL